MLVLPATAPTPKENTARSWSSGCRRSPRCCRRPTCGSGSSSSARSTCGTGPGRDGQPRMPFIWTLPETVALAKDCGPNMGAVLDVWHWHHSGGTVEDILAAGNDRIVHVHISDAKPAPPEEVRDNQRFMPGEGSIDLVGFLQALKKIGYADGVSPEPLGACLRDVGRGSGEARSRDDAGRDEESRSALTVGQTALAMVFGIAGVLSLVSAPHAQQAPPGGAQAPSAPGGASRRARTGPCGRAATGSGGCNPSTAIFTPTCATCHGPEGRGGPRLGHRYVRSLIATANDAGEQLAALLKTGRPEQGHAGVLDPAR